MQPSIVSLLLGGLAFAAPSLAVIDCKRNVTIANANDTRYVRENCRVIEGDLHIERTYIGDVDLEGVEVIKGAIVHDGCTEHDPPEEPGCGKDGRDDTPTTLSSSTLRELNDGLWFWGFRGLGKVLLPNLAVANGSVGFQRTKDLVEVDLKRLKHVGWLELGTPNLEKFSLDSLEGFAMGRISWTNPVMLPFGDLGSISSVDGIYKNALDPMVRGRWDPDDWYRLHSGPNLNEVTLGWTRLPRLLVQGFHNGLTVTLGGPDTESMRIEKLELQYDAYLVRAPTLKNLSVGSFELLGNSNVTELNLPFDDLSRVDVWGRGALRSITLPPQAADWRDLDMVIVYYDSLSLDSEFDSDGEQTWYWPKELKSLTLSANLTNEFFASFMAQNTTVREKIDIFDFSGRLDCDILKEYCNRTEGMTDQFTCSTKIASGALTEKAIHVWQVVMAAAIVSSLLA